MTWARRARGVRVALGLALALALLPIGACRLTRETPPPELAHVAALPLELGSVRFGVIGDSGTGGPAQVEVGQKLADAHGAFPFDFVLMVGDNMYGRELAVDFQTKFELPYKALLDKGVDFYAALGNHDDPNERFYQKFHMDGKRYYAFTKGNVRFFALDSNYMDAEQLDWLRDELSKSRQPWKICFFHHPLYSSGNFHGSEVDLRVRLEPLFVEHGVAVVFAGHEHFYERTVPQKGITYFISGAAAKLRRGDIRKTWLTASGFDTDNSFMLVEIAGDVMHFETISRTGALVDAGRIPRPGTELPAPSTSRNDAEPARTGGPGS